MGQLYTPHSLEKGLRATLLKHFAPDMTMLRILAFLENSDSDLESYDWVGQSPQMVEFKDERRAQALTNAKYSITNKTYEATLVVSRDQLADNKTQSAQKRIQQMAAVASAHPQKLLMETVVNGTDSTLGLCYDGVSFFNDAHPARKDEGGTQDNLGAGSGVTTSAIATDFAAAKTAILKFVGENGEPFWGDVIPAFHVVCPVELEKPFREVLQASVISQTTNVQAGMAQLHTSNRLTADTNDWYLFAEAANAKPFIWQDREGLQFESNTDGDDAFNKRQYSYGPVYRAGCGYGFWQCGYKVVNA